MLIEDIAYVMDDKEQRTSEWLQDYLNKPWKGVVRLNGITFPKREILTKYVAEPNATVYVPWRQELVTAPRVEFTTGKHSPLMFHALFISHMQWGRFEEGLEALETIPFNFLFGLATTVGTEEINPVNAHFLRGEARLETGAKQIDLFSYYFDTKEKLKCYGGLSKAALYRSMCHINSLQKMMKYSTLADDLPIKILNERPLALHKWLVKETK